LLPTNSVGTTRSVYLPSSWLESGFTSVSLGANGRIALAAGNNITLPAGGSFTAKADSIDIESSIIVPNRTIWMPGVFTLASADALSANIPVNPNSTISYSSGNLTIGAGITLSTAGLWTNDSSGTTLAPIAANGGPGITLGAYGDIDIGQGSV